jgi:hypothetical protein
MSVPFPRPLKLGDQGVDVEGVGRALCKTGFYVTLEQFQNADLEWRRTFGQRKVDAVNKVRAQAGWKRTGTYNEAVKDRLENKGFFDARAISLIKSWKPPPAPKEPQIRAAMSDFCIRAEAVEERWHYTQKRPFSGIGSEPERVHYGDCSAYCVLVYAWAKKVTNCDVRDPSGYNFAGYGNTWDDLDGHGRVTSYLVGDLAHWEGHVAICRKAGTRSTSVWSSFGSERGPHPVSLDYRSDFRFVCRPPILGA